MKVKTAKEPLVRIAKRTNLSKQLSYGIRVASVLVALLACGITLLLITSGKVSFGEIYGESKENKNSEKNNKKDDDKSNKSETKKAKSSTTITILSAQKTEYSKSEIGADVIVLTGDVKVKVEQGGTGSIIYADVIRNAKVSYHTVAFCSLLLSVHL